MMPPRPRLARRFLEEVSLPPLRGVLGDYLWTARGPVSGLPDRPPSGPSQAWRAQWFARVRPRSPWREPRRIFTGFPCARRPSGEERAHDHARAAWRGAECASRLAAATCRTRKRARASTEAGLRPDSRITSASALFVQRHRAPPLPPRLTSVARFSSVAERLLRLVRDDEVALLRGELAARVGDEPLARLSSRARSPRAPGASRAARAAPISASRSGFSHQRDRGAASRSFFSFVGLVSRGRWSATAAAITSASARERSAPSASPERALHLERAADVDAPSPRAASPATRAPRSSVTLRPARRGPLGDREAHLAARPVARGSAPGRGPRASAPPSRPGARRRDRAVATSAFVHRRIDDRLRLGSSARGPTRPTRPRRRTGPTSVTRPCVARARRRCACVAGWAHIRGCIAGAARTGTRARRARARHQIVRSPVARGARGRRPSPARSRSRPPRSAIATCISPENAGSHMSLATGSPQMPDSVTGPTNRAALRRHHRQRRCAPAFTRRRATSTLLYAAMLPVTASAIVRPARESEPRARRGPHARSSTFAMPRIRASVADLARPVARVSPRLASWAYPSASSASPTSANRRSSTRSRAPRPRRRTIPSARSSRTSASCRAGPAPAGARRRRARRPHRARRPSTSSTSPASCAARTRARGSATSSCRTSARSTRSCRSPAASRTRTSSTSRTGSTRSPTSRRSRPSCA